MTRDRAADRNVGERLLGTLDTISDGFFTLDREWRFTYMNAAAERLLQRTRAELIGRVVWDEFADAVGTESDHAYRRALAEGVTVSFEQYYPPLGWFQVEVYPSSEGLAVYFHDVTESRQQRESLRVSEERFRLLSTATNDAIWDWDLVTQRLVWNEGFTVLFGYPLNEIEPTVASWTTRLHPDSRETVTSSIRAAIAGSASSWSAEYQFRRRDGSYAWVLDRGRVIRDASGTGVRMIGGMTDLTERRRIEDQLREQATLLDKANDAILVRDLQHRVLYWNRSAEQLYGWTAAEIVGKTLIDLAYPNTTAFLAAVDQTIEHGEWIGELDQLTKERKPIIVECRWTLVRDDHGKPRSILAINTDITQRKQLEIQSMRAQRMDSIGALAGGIAHDLNNALAPILMAVSALRDDEKDPTRNEDLATIEACAQRGADMVRQLLSFARGSDGQRVPTDIGRIAAEIRKIARDTFPKDIAFRSSVTRDLWKVCADPTQLHQLLMNLCVNARDAMPHGGTLSVALEHVVYDEDSAATRLEARPGPYVVLRVADTGTGIAPEIVDRIFEPFFTTKEIGKGTGLGLSTAHAIVRNLGGFINVRSEVGVGTRFEAFLPADPASTTTSETPAPPNLPRGGGELILLVDDEEAIRTVARRTLEQYGYRVLLANNGVEAVALYSKHRREIAVVITDMSMPVMGGAAAIAALKAQNPEVRIIGSSGRDLTDNLAKAMGSGIEHFLAKPYTADALLTLLRTILGR